ncbi:MAG: leucine-rich repeat domain-containing protein [Clostridia bacterium]|nr:leucine-rich repeat domain-containing protein [Clostridia bacterium]
MKISITCPNCSAELTVEEEAAKNLRECPVCKTKLQQEKQSGGIALGVEFDAVDLSEDFEIQDGVLKKYLGFGGDLILPETVKEIGEKAFQGKVALKKVIIPSSVEKIGRNAFKDCVNLKSVVLSEGVKILNFGAFSGCEKLEEVLLPQSLTEIDDYAFNGVAVKSWTLPRGLKKIGDGCGGAFSRNQALTRAFIPESVEKIGDEIFSECVNLTEISVDENNKNYRSIDGNLYSKDGTVLAAYAVGKTDEHFSVPDGVTKILGEAFCGCRSLKTVTLPESLQSIGGDTFEHCANLTKLHIPAACSDFSYAIGDDCPSLAEITVAEKNERYRSIDGVLYEKDLSELMYFPKAKKCKMLKIPSKTKRIKLNALKDCKFLECVIFSSNADGIDLQDCTSLKKLVLPKDMEDWQGGVCGCAQLKQLELPKKLASLTWMTFLRCTSLQSLHIPAAFTDSLWQSGLDTCTSLKKITVDRRNQTYCSIGGNLYGKDKKTLVYYAAGKKAEFFAIPDGVETVNEDAFPHDGYLKRIFIPKSVTDFQFERGIGLGCYVEFAVDKNNTAYTAIDGNLYGKDGKILYKYAGGKDAENFVVPSGVEIIEDSAVFLGERLKTVQLPDTLKKLEPYAFCKCVNLETVVLPDGVTEIGICAFGGNEALESVRLPKTLKKMGGRIFLGCNKLKEIYFDGDCWQWEEMEKNPLWNADTTAEKVICNDGVIRLVQIKDPGILLE